MPKTPKTKSAFNHNQLHKCPTGIKGFDAITEGGLPKNRTTLFCGNTGTGKTLLGIDFLINGATRYDERGVFMSFEETEDELYEDVASLNLNLQRLVSQKKILLDHVLLERRDIQEKGDGGMAGRACGEGRRAGVRGMSHALRAFLVWLMWADHPPLMRRLHRSSHALRVITSARSRDQCWDQGS